MKKYKQMVFKDRQKIESLYEEGKSVREIADEIGRNVATIYNELHRGDTGEMDKNGRAGYSAEIAQRLMYENNRKRGRTPMKRKEKKVYGIKC